MSLFIEVQSEEKNCKVIINLEHVVEVAPLRDGGCNVFFSDSAAVNGTRSMKVKDSYPMFQQLAMQVVSSEDVAKKVKALKATAEKMEIPKL